MKRQEVGRGLRLCVNQDGFRIDEQSVGLEQVHKINKLTVVASESYKDFVTDLQKQIRTDLYERPRKASMYKANPEQFITKVIRLIKEQKATMIVEHISYDQLEGKYDSSIFTAEKHTTVDKAFRAEKHIQPYVFTDGLADKSEERRFAEDLDGADEVCVYAKLPKGFSIPTPVGNYSPDWAIAFNEHTVKHIFFIAETSLYDNAIKC